MRYDNIEDEIQHKLFQALAIWRDKEGPNSISIREAFHSFARTHPNITEDQFRIAVLSCSLFELDNEQIKLSKEVGNFSPEHPEGLMSGRRVESSFSHSKSEDENSTLQTSSSRKYAWILAILFLYIGYHLGGVGGSIIGAILGWIIGGLIKK